MQYLRVKNWDDHQQYKDGRPVQWIKLQTALLDDYGFDCLPENLQIHLCKIWLLAGKLDNRIPNDARWVGRQIGAQSEVDINQLVKAGFLVPYESVHNRTETYADPEPSVPRVEKSRVEKSREEEKPRKRTPAKTKLAETELPTPWREYCRTKRPELDPDATFENFRDYWIGHGKPMADWLATWQRWVRNEQSGTARRKSPVRETNDERRAREADEYRRHILAN